MHTLTLIRSVCTHASLLLYPKSLALVAVDKALQCSPLVPVPFCKEVYPLECWSVGILPPFSCQFLPQATHSHVSVVMSVDLIVACSIDAVNYVHV